MRFGRTAAGHNIMRFGRAGHNIMHFGKRGSASDEPATLAEALNEAYNDPDSIDAPALANLYVLLQTPLKQQPVTNFSPATPYLRSSEFLPSNYPIPNQSSVLNTTPEKKSLSEMLFAPPNASSSLARRVLMPHLFLSSFYSPYINRRLSTYNYNKKADRDRDNVFMHFG